tara:strand:+ start:1862 stop:3277 length:1416 start_codon:yes stop_codon:yes gene_type:complete
MATQFDFNSSPFSFSDSSGPSNPFLEEVPILGLQDFETPSFGQSEFGTPSFGQDQFSFGQNVPVVSRDNEPGFLYNTFVNAPVELDRRATNFMGDLLKNIGAGYNDLIGSAIRNFAGEEEMGYTPEPFLKTFTDTFDITRPGGEKFFPDAQPVENQFPQQVNQDFVPSNEMIDEFSPASNLFSLDNAMQVNPMMQEQDLESFASPSQIPEQTLSQFMRNEDDPSQRTEQFVDAQGRLRRKLTPEASALQGFAPDSVILAPEYAGFEQAADDRFDRLMERDPLPGETAVQRDIRLANAETAGSDNVPLDVIEAINTPSNRRSPAQIKRISQWESSEQGKAMGGVSGLVQERTQFEPRVVEIEGQRLIQLSPTYYQPIRPEPTEEEKFEPRVLENNGFVYFEESANNFKRQPSSDFEKVQDMIDRSEQLGITMKADGVGLYTEEQEADIQRVMSQHSVSRIEAINEMRKQKYL